MAAHESAGELSYERKAAILVLLLGEQANGAILKQLSPRDVARLARQIANLGPISAELADQVLQEYWLEAMQAPQDHGGPEAARRILAQADISEEIVDQLVRRESGSAGEVLGPLLEAPPEILARALQDEHPQTTALVLLNLPARRAARVLAALPEARQSETILRMVTMRQVRGEVIGQVATSLRERLSSQKEQQGLGGLDRTASVLASLNRIDTKRVLDELEAAHPDEVARLRGELFTFDSLIAADDRGLQELLRSVDSSRLGMALIGADPVLVDRILNNLSERAAGMIREEMEFIGTPNPDEQAAGRKEILDMALKLEADGRMNFAQDATDDDAD